MGALLSSFASWLSSIFASLFSFMTSHFLATKIILTTLFITVLPIVIYNLIYDITSEIYSIISSNLSSFNISQTVYSFTGLAGYLIVVLKLDQAFSVVISAIALRFTLRLIPFIRI